MAKFRSVRVGKIDLDTCGAALLLGVTREHEVVWLRSAQASQEELSDPSILCVEVGGSGRVAEGNFDHHGAGSEGLPSATLQAWRSLERCPSCGHPVGERGLGDPAEFVPVVYMCEGGRPADEAVVLARMVEYINILDTEGPEPLRRLQREKKGFLRNAEPIFPTLADVFAGMLLTERDPVGQFRLGVEILQEAVHRLADPFGRMPVEEVAGWSAYAEATAENNRQIAKALRDAQWGKTASGLKLAWLESSFFGTPGALYGEGAQVIVAFAPRFGPAGVPKFTVAGNGIRVDSVLPELNARESGWGGPGTGTILGSPREGSKMTLNEVVEMVRRTL